MTGYSRAAALQGTVVSILDRTLLPTDFAGSPAVASTFLQDEQLGMVAREMMRGLGADELLIAWHRGGDPILLFDSSSGNGLAGDDMRQCATRTALGGRADGTWFSGESASGDLLSAPIATEHGTVTVTASFRRSDAATRPHARDAAAHLLPLVKPFFRLWAERTNTSAHLRGLTAALNKSDVGTVLVDRHAQLLFANTVAETLMAEVDGVRRVGQVICGTRLADTLRLQAAIEHVISASETSRVGLSAPAPVLALTRKARRPLMAAVVACEDPTSDRDGGTAIVFLFDPEEDLRAVMEPVCKLYDLTPMESKLACLLAAGISLAEAADGMKVREQTARSYLKQVFLKTDTNRQAELVWLMLKSSIRTAPGCRTSFI